MRYRCCSARRDLLPSVICDTACACVIAGLTVTSIVLVQVQQGGVTVPAFEVRPAMTNNTL